MNQTINPAILDSFIEGVNVPRGTFRHHLGSRPTLLIFLRHFGCMFCRETVQELRKLVAERPDYPPILFFYMGTRVEGEAFFRQRWPSARAVPDAEKRFYDAFGMRHGNLIEVYGPEVWFCVVRAASKGITPAVPKQDQWMLPGMFLVNGDRILWQHEYRHAGDHPNFRAIAEQVPAAI
jgi:hypothetical protein